MINVGSPKALAAEIGSRIRQARLNANLTQQEVADQAGVSRKAIAGAESGKVQLETLLAIMTALQLTSQLDAFLPNQPLSPIQLAKLHGKTRQKAGGQRKSLRDKSKTDDTTW